LPIPLFEQDFTQYYSRNLLLDVHILRYTVNIFINLLAIILGLSNNLLFAFSQRRLVILSK
jgi:hypothetical protein